MCHVCVCRSLQALSEKNAAIAESERCQCKLGLANRLIAALASEGDRWALTVQQLRKDYQVSEHDLKCAIHSIKLQLFPCLHLTGQAQLVL